MMCLRSARYSYNVTVRVAVMGTGTGTTRVFFVDFENKCVNIYMHILSATNLEILKIAIL